MTTRLSNAIGVISLLVLAGCGGGGGGGSSSYPLRLSVSPSPITGSVSQIDLPGSITFNASVTGSTSTGTIYVVVQDSAATFSGAPGISQLSDTLYQATLPLSDVLTTGSHSGDLTISLCGEPACANVLGRTTAPYVVTITESPVVTGSFSRASVSIASVRGDEQTSYPLQLSTPSSWYAIKYATFSDPANVLRIAGGSQTILAPWGATDFQITVAPDLPPGIYSGVLEMTYCRFLSCARTYRGTTELPYTVTVYPQTNLKTLAALPGAGDWPVLQGTPARTGHVPATLNPANFSPRWLWRSPDPANLVNVLEPVNSGGKVFTMAAPSSVYAITPLLFAIDEASGEVSWQKAIPDPGSGPWNGGLGPLAPPAIAGDSVYVSRTVGSYPRAEGTMVSFRVADGVSTFPPPVFPETPGEFGEYTHEYLSRTTWFSPGYMTPRGGLMVLTGRLPDNAGITQIASDLDTGASSAPWASCLASMNFVPVAGAAAVDGDGATYLATANGLLLADTCEMIATPVSIASGFGPVVVPGTRTVIAVGSGNLVAFDIATRRIKWSALSSESDDFVGSPAIADGIIFVQNSAYPRVRLEARRESDGAILWTWEPPWSDELGLSGNVVSTNNLVFVSTQRAVYAIDRATHQQVWTYPYGGKISISANGVLYVRRGFIWFGSALAAINLQ